jgi:stage II sporulation protein D
MRALGVLIVAALAVALLVAAPAGAATTFLIRGGGYGHGVGMSQYGAFGYALHGTGYRFILAHYYRGTKLGTVDSQRTIRVLLATGPAAFGGATRAGTKKLNPSLTYDVRALPGGSLRLVGPGGRAVARFTAPLEVTGAGPLEVVGLGAYRGALQFRPDGAGGVQTVDAVGLEDYVRGVIAAEMPSGWSSQALDAQAVAARTYAITSDAGGAGFDVYSDTRSQMYRGVSAEEPATDAAVSATRGQVVVYRGTAVPTYFFSSSGGHTENIENVWRGSTPQPWLKGVPDPYDGAGGDPYHRWAYDLTLSAAASKLGHLVRGRLVGIVVTKHGASPRIIRAEVVGTRGRTRVSGGQLQQKFGLLSTDAAFTTISTQPALRAPPPAHPRMTLAQDAERAALADALPGLHGTIFPSGGGAFGVQLRGRGGWRTVARGAVGADGAYAVRLPGPGTYRVVYRGLDGPAVGAV